MSSNCIHTPECTQNSSEMMPSTEKKRKIRKTNREIELERELKRKLKREQQQIGKNHPLQVNLKWSEMIKNNNLNEHGTFL